MSWVRGSGRVAADYGFAGAVIGFVLSLVVFVVLLGLTIMVDSGRWRRPVWCNTCLFRMAALLALTFGMGIGYMIGRSNVVGLVP